MAHNLFADARCTYDRKKQLALKQLENVKHLYKITHFKISNGLVSY